MTDAPEFAGGGERETAVAQPEKPWTVKSADGRRTFFEGLEDDARTYLANNFPRLHVEPGNTAAPSPDAHLHNPSGGKEFFDGTQFTEVEK